MNFPKISNKVWLLLSAGLGGTALTWVELATNPKGADQYFFLGAFGAFIVGAIAWLLVGDTTVRSAITTGIAGPNILGGFVKAGTTVVAWFEIGTLSLFPSAYAGDNVSNVKKDSIKIEISVKGTEEEVTIKNLENNQVYIANYNNPVKVPFSDSLEIEVNGLGKQLIEVDKDYVVDSTKKLDVIVIQKKRTNNILRALFPNQRHDPLTKKFKVKEVEQKQEKAVQDTTIKINGEQ